MILVVFPTAWMDFLPDTLVSPDVAVVIHLAQDRTEQKNLEMLEILDFFYLSIDSLKRYQSIRY